MNNKDQLEEYKFYWDNKKLHSIVTYKNQLLDGKYIIYHPNGQVYIYDYNKDNFSEGEYIRILIKDE